MLPENRESPKSKLWIFAAYRLIYKTKQFHFTLSELCTEAKLTKGAFYHYFQNMPEFHLRVLEYWYSKQISDLSDVSRLNLSFERKLLKLIQLSEHTPQNPEMGMRSFAVQSEKMEDILHHLDKYRVQFLVTWIEQSGHVGDMQKIKKIASLLYSAMIGAKIINKNLKPSQICKFISEIRI